MFPLLKASEKWFPSTLPPIRKDPGEFMVEKVEQALPQRVREQIPKAVEAGAAQMSALGYGVTFGALYAATRPSGEHCLRDGLLLGAIAWAAGYLGWLPALKLMPPVWRQEPARAIVPAVEHLAYGLATVAAYDWLKGRI
jgi:hypothetical protein